MSSSNPLVFNLNARDPISLALCRHRRVDEAFNVTFLSRGRCLAVCVGGGMTEVY